MNYNKSMRIAAAASLVVLLGGCGIYKKYQLPDVPQSQAMNEYRHALASDSSAVLGWEEVFTDTLLQNIIREALVHNKDLDNARKNVDIARAQLKGARLSYFPSATLSPNGGSASYGGSHMNWSYTIPLALNWEIDAFGKILNRKRGAEASLEQTEAYRQAAQSQIVCAVASTYYSLVLLHNQYGLSKRTSEIWKDQVETMKLMKQAGMVNEAAVVQSEAQYYNIMASLPDIESQINQVNNTLCILTGHMPNFCYIVNKNLDFDIPTELVEGVPVSYLAIRPDVAAAERALAAAYYQTNSARAAFYPSLAITSQGGFTNLLGGMIKNPGEWFIQLAGQLTAPLFSRGQNIATLEAAKASQQIALNNFESTVMNASAEVSNALYKYEMNAKKRKYVELQVQSLEKSVEITQELLTLNQSTTYLEVLTAQSSLLNSQLASLACWHNEITALIDLYQAIGGGY